MAEPKVALVTGVSSGIGRVVVNVLLDAGFRTFGTVRDPAKLTQQSGKLELVPLEVSQEDSIRSLVQTVVERAGRIDALVNNAGTALIGSSEETSVDEARSLFDVNFFGVLQLVQQVLPVMRKQGSGRIVNISSVVGFVPAPYMGLYAATKHAVEGYSESLDHEVRQFGIRVLVVEPGFTRTNLGQKGQLVNHPLEVYARDRTSALEAIRRSIAHGDEPEVVASVVLKALTDRSPRLRYQAGREAKLLNLLRRWAPAKLLDKGLRKQFGLEAK